ncbi:hypothetical protein GH714_041296 [Hevea brasiliensis]|uniref:Protein kinase domain-containing protein n=1 Tax=Hevea brasiliensis TaxID=3981 RepID=A0A6A6MVS0_HEVBR|nr:hypothetical protein GH714_041296 [Hevea brasiliensis]
MAIDRFSDAKKLGQGGFGIVYKQGKLSDDLEVAVKRPSVRNLVRPLGCCAEGEEKILIYGYMPNKTLDSIFERSSLNWKRGSALLKGLLKASLPPSVLHDGLTRIQITQGKSSLVSWLSPSLPSSGSFAFGMDPVNKSQINLWQPSDKRDIGFWDGQCFRFIFQSSSDRYNFSFISNNKDSYLTYGNDESITPSWFVLASSGDINE